MSVELKPCPFCGGEAVLTPGRESYSDGYNEWAATVAVVGCGRNNCPACPAVADTEADDFIAIWNRRHGVRTPEEEAVLRAAVEMRRSFSPSQPWNAWDRELAEAVDALLAAEPKWGG